MLLGWKNDPEFPKAINALTFRDHMDKIIPGFRDAYDRMSEFAHPNYSGVFGLFARTDYKNYETHFGRGLRSSYPQNAVPALLHSALLLFEHAYNSITDAMPGYLSELEPL